MSRPAVARVQGSHLRHNAQRVRELAPGSRVLACVKANGYGHGMIPVSEILSAHSDGLAVACMEEAQALREGGYDGDIVLLEGVLAPAEWRLAAEHELTVCIAEEEQLRWLRECTDSRRQRCWLKIDTGMHRLGLGPAHLPAALKQLRDDPRVASTVTLSTHFARADEPEYGDTEAQLALFKRCTDALQLPRSAANSAAILSLPESHFDWLRPGYMLYGGCPFGDRSAADCDLRAAMSFESAVISLREVARGESVGYGSRWVAQRPSRIATIAAGYGDGYPRHAVDGTPVMIGDRRAPLAGCVSMDMITVDVTDLDSVHVGTCVELWGAHLPVDEIARSAGTIGYELLARMPARVPRRYVS